MGFSDKRISISIDLVVEMNMACLRDREKIYVGGTQRERRQEIGTEFGLVGRGPATEVVGKQGTSYTGGSWS